MAFLNARGQDRGAGGEIGEGVVASVNGNRCSQRGPGFVGNRQLNAVNPLTGFVQHVSSDRVGLSRGREIDIRLIIAGNGKGLAGRIEVVVGLRSGDGVSDSCFQHCKLICAARIGDEGICLRPAQFHSDAA